MKTALKGSKDIILKNLSKEVYPWGSEFQYFEYAGKQVVMMVHQSSFLLPQYYF
jgi:hypothetical protein